MSRPMPLEHKLLELEVTWDKTIAHFAHLSDQ